MDDDNENEGSSDGRATPASRISINSNPNVYIKFRNYTPQTEFLDGSYTVEKSIPGSINHLIKDKLDLVADGDYKIDPKLLDPKKIDWDLKRRLEKRLDLLDGETKKGISRHIKDTRKKR